MNSASVWRFAASALSADEVETKLNLVGELAAELATAVPPAPTFSPPADVLATSRRAPARPLLVRPQDVPQRKPVSPIGRDMLLHAIAHIEFTAIDLALDHALRFPGQPAGYCRDWLGVAVEEARHFRLVRDHLRSLGKDYGDFPAHDSLWRMAERTAGDVLARMALVPRLLEARGLDATPPIRQRLADAGDTSAVAILDIILRDEIGHVGLGDKWFRELCRQRDLEPEITYRQLIQAFDAPWPSQPMNVAARQLAGFGVTELRELAASPRERRVRGESPGNEAR